MNQKTPTPTQMPKVTNMPAPLPPARPIALCMTRTPKRLFERHSAISIKSKRSTRLGQELEEWRRRAMMSEAEVKKLEKREQDLRDTLDRERDKLTDERNSYRNKLNMLVSQFHTAGAIILKCLEAAQGVSGPQINLTTLANEIDKIEHQPEKTEEAEESMPRVVTAGPRID